MAENRRFSQTLKPDQLELVGPATRIIGGALGVVAGESVVVLADKSRRSLGGALIAAAEALGAKATLLVLEELSLPPDGRLAEFVEPTLAHVQASVVLVGAEHSPPLRRAFVEAVEHLGIRHAHIIGITRAGFIAGFAAESSRVADMTRAAYLKLTGKTKLRYTTPAGTAIDIRMSPDARWIERGELIRPGKWLNLPGGQLNALPEAVDGVFVANASSNLAFDGSADLRSRPIRFTLENGVVREVTCADAKVEAEVRELIASEEKLDHVGHIVVGTNPGLSAPMGEGMIDACIPGVQLVFGWTNQKVTGASWTTVKSFCVNGSSGNLDVEGVPVLRSGRYL